MEPYFKYVEGINFKKETREQIADYFLTNFNLFVPSSSKPTKKFGEYDWNFFLPKEHMPAHLLSEVGDRFKIPVTYDIIGQQPYTNGKIHVDRIMPGIPPRVTLINFPIYPLDPKDFGPTRYWELVEGTYEDYDNAVFDLKAEVDYTKELPVIFNLQKYHNAVNMRNDYRFNAQFTTDLPFEVVVDLYNKGELFS